MFNFRDSKTVAPVDSCSCCTFHTSKSMPRKIPAHSFDFSFLNPPGFFFCFFYGLADALIDLVSPVATNVAWQLASSEEENQEAKHFGAGSAKRLIDPGKIDSFRNGQVMNSGTETAVSSDEGNCCRLRFRGVRLERRSFACLAWTHRGK